MGNAGIQVDSFPVVPASADGDVPPGKPSPGAAPTSLVPMDQTVDEIRAHIGPNLCPRIDHERQFWINIDTGEKRPDSCRANACPHCIGFNAIRKARILSWARPERYAVLTQAPEDWDKLRQKMRDLPRLLNRRGYSWAHGWTVEINPQDTGLHVNALQRGTYVPQDILQDVWGSIVHIQAVRYPKGVATYAVKEAMQVTGYTLKDAGSGADTSAHLAANGGRLVHCSRDYFPMNPSTDRPYTQAQVWNELRRETDSGWRLVLA